MWWNWRACTRVRLCVIEPSLSLIFSQSWPISAAQWAKNTTTRKLCTLDDDNVDWWRLQVEKDHELQITNLTIDIHATSYPPVSFTLLRNVNDLIFSLLWRLCTVALFSFLLFTTKKKKKIKPGQLEKVQLRIYEWTDDDNSSLCTVHESSCCLSAISDLPTIHTSWEFISCRPWIDDVHFCQRTDISLVD